MPSVIVIAIWSDAPESRSDAASAAKEAVAVLRRAHGYPTAIAAIETQEISVEQRAEVQALREALDAPPPKPSAEAVAEEGSDEETEPFTATETAGSPEVVAREELPKRYDAANPEVVPEPEHEDGPDANPTEDTAEGVVKNPTPDYEGTAAETTPESNYSEADLDASVVTDEDAS